MRDTHRVLRAHTSAACARVHPRPAARSTWLGIFLPVRATRLPWDSSENRAESSGNSDKLWELMTQFSQKWPEELSICGTGRVEQNWVCRRAAATAWGAMRAAKGASGAPQELGRPYILSLAQSNNTQTFGQSHVIYFLPSLTCAAPALRALITAGTAVLPCYTSPFPAGGRVPCIPEDYSTSPSLVLSVPLLQGIIAKSSSQYRDCSCAGCSVRVLSPLFSSWWSSIIAFCRCIMEITACDVSSPTPEFNNESFLLLFFSGTYLLPC